MPSYAVWILIAGGLLGLDAHFLRGDVSALVGCLILWGALICMLATVQAGPLTKREVTPLTRRDAQIMLWMAKGSLVLQGAWCGLLANRPWLVFGLYMVAVVALSALGQGTRTAKDPAGTRPSFRSLLGVSVPFCAGLIATLIVRSVITGRWNLG